MESKIKVVQDQELWISDVDGCDGPSELTEKLCKAVSLGTSRQQSCKQKVRGGNLALTIGMQPRSGERSEQKR